MKKGSAEDDAMGPSKVHSVNSLSYEQAVQELEAIVRRLEGDAFTLEESVKAFERGEALRSHCEALLNAAEARIEKIKLSSKGEVLGTAPLDPPNETQTRTKEPSET